MDPNDPTNIDNREQTIISCSHDANASQKVQKQSRISKDKIATLGVIAKKAVTQVGAPS